MLIRSGYEISLRCELATPLIAYLSIHPSRSKDLRTPSPIVIRHGGSVSTFRDPFGNVCTRVLVPAGTLTFSTDFVIEDSGRPDEVAPHAPEVAVGHLPDDVLRFLLPSRYCETDRLSPLAWSLFAGAPRGWQRVQAVVEHVHDRLTFGYEYASALRSAWDAYEERVGVCRDFAHLAIAFCRCLNIPARYCTGYLGDIGVPAAQSPMDFSAWFEAYLGDRWYAFDARHNTPRVGRILMARGRDAADVALTTTFGPSTLTMFRVFTDEVYDVKAA